MSFAYRFTALVLGALALACDFPIDDSKYKLDNANFERIVEAFSDGNQDCKACVSGCVESINQCADTEGCTEFAECVRREANPAGQASCASEMVDVPFPVTLAYTDVAYCWMDCGSRCAVGTNWDCLDGYGVTQTPKDEVRIQQSFKHCEGDAVRGAHVEYCDYEEDCDKRTSTDDWGTYTVHIGINRQGPLAGWRGFRRVEGSSSDDPLKQLLAPHRLERNLPIWSDHVESTMLLSAGCAYGAGKALAAADDSADWGIAVAIQTFDCHTSGAQGVVLEVTTAPNAKVLYAESDGAEVWYIKGSSTASGDGLALVAELPDGEHQIVAREPKSGKTVGTAYVTMPASEVIMYNLLPKPVE